MSKDRFIANDDMFGAYVKIPTGASMAMHIYKVVGRIESNRYCDVPIMAGTKAALHSEIVPVLNVVHCGVSEDTIIRVSLSDCEIVQQPNAPLTLNELGKIYENEEGPVWVTHGVAVLPAILDRYDGELVAVWNALGIGTALRAKDYGVLWLAYRRKPEEETP